MALVRWDPFREMVTMRERKTTRSSKKMRLRLDNIIRSKIGYAS